MDEEVYLHTLFASKFYSSKKSLNLLEKILISNELLSRKLQGLSDSINFCGEDYISLVDLKKRNQFKSDEYNSYLLFARFNPSIIFPNNIFDVVEPVILPLKIADYYDSVHLMQMLGASKDSRYTDLLDEVQVKDRISLDFMIGFMLPSYEVLNFWRNDSINMDIVKRECEKYRELLIKYGHDVPIYDSITFRNLDDEEEIKQTVKELKLFNKRYKE